MSGVESISGSFPKIGDLVASCGAHDGLAGPGVTDRTDGFFAAVPLTASPTQSQPWELLGFSASIRMFAVHHLTAFGLNSALYWARFGDIWAGIVKDTPIPTPTPVTPKWPRADFPSDLSTLTRIWNGAEDYIAVAKDSVSNSAITPVDISVSTVLPFPITVQPGSQLGFALIMTQSIIDALLTIDITDVRYTVNYNLKRR
jgi:hypothetical protein